MQGYNALISMLSESRLSLSLVSSASHLGSFLDYRLLVFKFYPSYVCFSTHVACPELNYYFDRIISRIDKTLATLIEILASTLKKVQIIQCIRVLIA